MIAPYSDMKTGGKMEKYIKTLSISLFAATAMIILPLSQSNAAVSSNLNIEDPSLFGLFCGCNFCDWCCEEDRCDPCEE